MCLQEPIKHHSLVLEVTQPILDGHIVLEFAKQHIEEACGVGLSRNRTPNLAQDNQIASADHPVVEVACVFILVVHSHWSQLSGQHAVLFRRFEESFVSPNGGQITVGKYIHPCCEVRTAEPYCGVECDEVDER